MKYLILLAAIAAFATAEVEKDEGVLVLTDDNFDEELKNHDAILLEFYAPWCGHCKKLAPEYVKAAEKLAANEPPYYVAKVDATANTELAKRFGIKGYPTLKWYRNGDYSEYNGGRTADEIVNWILKKVGPPSRLVGAQADLDSIKKDNKVAVVYFGTEQDNQFTLFQKAAGDDDKTAYVHVTDASLIQSLGVSTPGLVIYRQFDEPTVTFEGEFTVAAIKEFVKKNSVPTLIEFDEDYIDPIFGEHKPALFLFRDKESEQGKKLSETFGKIAEELKGKILFAVSGVTDGIQQRLADYVGAEQAKLPQVILVHPKADGIHKFVYSGDVSAVSSDNMGTFIQEWKDGKIEKHLKSEDIPATQDEPVKVIVGKSFQSEVVDSGKDVLLEFYAPWCGHCKKLAPIYDELATELKDVANLVIAKIDATANEVESVDVRGFPTIKFFKAGVKKELTFEGDRTKEGFIEYLKENSEAYKKYLQDRGEL